MYFLNEQKINSECLLQNGQGIQVQSEGADVISATNTQNNCIKNSSEDQCMQLIQSADGQTQSHQNAIPHSVKFNQQTQIQGSNQQMLLQQELKPHSKQQETKGQSQLVSKAMPNTSPLSLDEKAHTIGQDNIIIKNSPKSASDKNGLKSYQMEDRGAKDHTNDEANPESEGSSSGVAPQESESKQSLRRTTRVKTAKNHSEFIYFGKYNKELMHPRSYSKNNQQPIQGNVDVQSQNQSKSQLTAQKTANAKRNQTSGQCQSSQGATLKKTAQKNQNRNLFGIQSPVGMVMPSDNKDGADLNNFGICPKQTNQHTNTAKDRQLKVGCAEQDIKHDDVVDQSNESQGQVNDENQSTPQMAHQTIQHHNNNHQKLFVNNKKMDDNQTKKELQHANINKDSSVEQTSKQSRSVDQQARVDVQDVQMDGQGQSQLQQDQKTTIINKDQQSKAVCQQAGVLLQETNSQVDSQNARDSEQPMILDVNQKTDTQEDRSLQPYAQTGLDPGRQKQQGNNDKEMQNEEGNQSTNLLRESVHSLKSMQDCSTHDVQKKKAPSTQLNQKPEVLISQTNYNDNNEKESHNQNSLVNKDGNSQKEKSEKKETEVEDDDVNCNQEAIKKQQEQQMKQESSQMGKQVYCICRTTDETNMICCDKCEEWYHFHCVGIQPNQIIEYDSKPYFCSYSKKCIDFQNKKKLKKAPGQHKEQADDKKHKNDAKYNKTSDLDKKQPILNKKGAEDSYSDIFTNKDSKLQKQNEGSVGIDRKKTKNCKQKNQPVTNQAAITSELQQIAPNSKSNTSKLTGDQNQVTKNSQRNSQQKQENKTASKQITAEQNEKVDQKARVDNKSIQFDQKTQNSQSTLQNKKSSKESKNTQGSSNNVTGPANKNQKLKQTNNNNSNQPNNTVQNAQGSMIVSQQKAQHKQKKQELTYNKTSQQLLVDKKGAKETVEKESANNKTNSISNLTDKKKGNNQSHRAASLAHNGVTQVIKEDKQGFQLSLHNDLQKRETKLTDNKRKDKVIMKEAQQMQSIKENKSNENSTFQDLQQQILKQTCNQTNLKAKKQKDSELDQSFNTKDEMNKISSSELRLLKKGRKEKKQYNGYIQANQQFQINTKSRSRQFIQSQTQSDDISSLKKLPINHIPFSFQMLGMTAPNILMSGGINNLIYKIKQLNLQMSAAIIQAEKMSRLSHRLNTFEGNLGQQLCQTCKTQINKMLNDPYFVLEDLSDLQNCQKCSLLLQLNKSRLNTYLASDCDNIEDIDESIVEIQAQLSNLLLKRQKLTHVNPQKQSSFAQNNFPVGSNAAQIESIRQQLQQNGQQQYQNQKNNIGICDNDQLHNKINKKNSVSDDKLNQNESLKTINDRINQAICNISPRQSNQQQLNNKLDKSVKARQQIVDQKQNNLNLLNNDVRIRENNHFDDLNFQAMNNSGQLNSTINQQHLNPYSDMNGPLCQENQQKLSTLNALANINQQRNKQVDQIRFANAELCSGMPIHQQNIPQKGKHYQLNNNNNLNKNGSSTKGYSSDDEEQQRLNQQKQLIQGNISVHNKSKAVPEDGSNYHGHAAQQLNNYMKGAHINENHIIDQNMDNEQMDDQQAGNNTNYDNNCVQNLHNIHEFLQEVVDADSQEFQNLTNALDLDEQEMEQEARMRLAQEGQQTIALKQDKESIRLMKQALLLEKILANFDTANQSQSIQQAFDDQLAAQIQQSQSPNSVPQQFQQS